MRIAVFSDVHANLEAFRAVLADMDAQALDEVYCLGDTIGYGPEPEACVGLLRERGIPSTLGNHDLGVIDSDHLNWFNPPARKALKATREMLSAETLAFLATLPRSLVRHGARMVHGVPPDDVSTYLFELDQANLKHMLTRLDEPLCFVGHTHELRLVSLDSEDRVSKRKLKPGRNFLEPGPTYVVNVGSVGQPRDGDNRAKYVIWDTVSEVIELRRVAYDIKKTAKAILALGFDSHYAERLY